MRIVSLLIFLIILFVGVGFAVVNAEPTVFNYYFGSAKLPLSLLLVIGLGIGALIGWCTGLAVWLRLKRENAKLLHQLKLKSVETDKAV